MRRFLVLGLTVAISGPRLAAAQQPAVPVDTMERVLNRVFDAWRDTEGPGCAVGISRNGRTVYEHGYGMANLETGTPIRPASIFHVASISKQFTAMAVLLLAREGKLSLDDNLRKYVPEIPDYGTPITIRQLLSHTSGLRDQWELMFLARGRYQENRITEADIVAALTRQTALNFAPGSEWGYSSSGFTLLAVIVKRVSGMSLRAFADERIFRPLGMTSTHFHDDYTMLVPGRASAYERRRGEWHVSIPNFDTYGATSLYSTVGDLLKWEANFERPIVGDRELIAQMETPARLTTGENAEYGFGLQLIAYRGAREVSHGGVDAGYRTYLGRFPAHGLALAVLCNAGAANPSSLAHAVVDAYIGDALAPVAVEVAPVEVPIPVAILERRAGAYVQPTTLEVIEPSMRGGRLILGRSNGPALIPTTPNRFRVAGRGFDLLFGDGEHPNVERIAGTGGHPTSFEWRPLPRNSSSDLAAYAGEYYSEELDAHYQVIAGDSTLTFRIGTTESRARPLYLDAFGWGGLDGQRTVRFFRKGDRVTGFDVTEVRMRGVKFARVSAPR